MSNNTAGQLVRILLVEDNPADVRLTQIVFEECRLVNSLVVVHDGDEALRFLRREGPYQQEPRPDLVLLDLNLPKKSGYEVLEEVNADDSLRGIPIIVLTGSSQEKERLRELRVPEHRYILKPVDILSFLNAVLTIPQLGLSLVCASRRAAGAGAASPE